MPTPHDVRRTTTQALSVALMIIGVALIARMAGIGNVIGIVLGVLFVAAGAGRYYVTRKAAP